ncbi:predicted protein [Sclerotinia sclerotiorum 1980 UF-70]|uniref:Uncharacterized protein n=1 Tax=Sclerotinia sclerotiorum (strain ATCC 18683 / 1980 / Ss-1) TaxID=665079 RepID=A7EYM9_SCLS1|nr:predicted protein [Sclerotinia sclerotiorum 1980 UF-70]EDN94571.1 predicted protein [Sclerotinia sclerotiorum 1980 UF-70]
MLHYKVRDNRDWLYNTSRNILKTWTLNFEYLRFSEYLSTNRRESSFCWVMTAKPASDRSPSISNYQEGGVDFGLSSRGERQCDELYENVRKHAGYITHIFSSPMKRCVETARKGLLEATGRGVRIQIMPTLAGRNSGIPWTLREENQEQDISGPWVGEVADPRSKTKDADFVIGWLNGKDLSLQEAQKVLEVVVVSQMQLLQELLWRIKGVWRREIGDAAVKKQKKEEIIKKQKEDSILVVDRETNEIVTFGEFQKFLKERHAKEFQETENPVAKRRRRR